MEFGINEVLAIIIFIISVFLLISEIKTTKATDLITNIIIAFLLGGISIYNLISLGFKASSVIITILYMGIILITIAYIIVFVLHFKREKSEKEQEQDE